MKRWGNCTNDRCTTDDIFDDTPLITAARNGHVELVRVLLEDGANVETVNNFQETALHRATYYGQLEVCRLLLDWGAKVDPLDILRDTPLYYAANKGNLSMVKLLVERGADVKLRNNKGQTASDVARINGKENVAKWLDLVSR